MHEPLRRFHSEEENWLWPTKGTLHTVLSKLPLIFKNLPRTCSKFPLRFDSLVHKIQYLATPKLPVTVLHCHPFCFISLFQPLNTAKLGLFWFFPCGSGVPLPKVLSQRFRDLAHRSRPGTYNIRSGWLWIPWEFLSLSSEEWLCLPRTTSVE